MLPGATEKDDFVLPRYSAMLESALGNGYRFEGFDRIGREAGERTCLLRHDIDNELWGCLPMAELEHRLGVSATYFVMVRATAYNLFCVESLRVVQALIRMGHALGLHFMGELCEKDSTEVLVAKVMREADILRKEFSVPIVAVSFHQPTKRILDGEVNVEGLVNTYNRRQMSNYRYISDSNMRWRDEHPQEIFQRADDPRIHLLTHPMWWTTASATALDKWRGVAADNGRIVRRHWLDREVTLKGVSEL